MKIGYKFNQTLFDNLATDRGKIVIVRHQRRPSDLCIDFAEGERSGRNLALNEICKLGGLRRRRHRAHTHVFSPFRDNYAPKGYVRWARSSPSGVDISDSSIRSQVRQS